MFSYRSFTVLAFIFRFMVHPKLVCVYRRRSVFILFPLEYPVDPELLVKTTSLFPIEMTWHSGQKSTYSTGIGLFLFHWSIFLHLCKDHIVLITVALQWVLEISRLSSVSSPTSPFFWTFFWATLDFLCFHIHFRINC